MKSETNRALWAKKKNYIQPSVEDMLVTMGANVMVGSDSTLPVSQTPIPGGGD